MLDMIACQNSLQEEFQILSESALYDSFDNVVSLAYPLPFFCLFLFYSFFKGPGRLGPFIQEK